MTGHIVRICGGDLSYNSIDYNSLFAIGLMLVPDHAGAEHDQPADRAPLPGGVRMNDLLSIAQTQLSAQSLHRRNRTGGALAVHFPVCHR